MRIYYRTDRTAQVPIQKPAQRHKCGIKTLKNTKNKTLNWRNKNHVAWGKITKEILGKNP